MTLKYLYDVDLLVRGDIQRSGEEVHGELDGKVEVGTTSLDVVGGHHQSDVEVTPEWVVSQE